MTDEIRTILLALAYAMEEGEIDAGGVRQRSGGWPSTPERG